MASEKETKKFVSDDGVSTAATPEKPEGGTAEVDPKKKNVKSGEEIKKRTTPVKESIMALFDETDLSEEFKEQIAAIFESAVDSRAKEIAEEAIEEAKAELKENAQEQGQALLEQAQTHTMELLEGVSRYLDYAAEKFIAENEIAIESALAVEKATRLMEGLQTIMAEARVEVSEESIDLFADLEESIDVKDAQINDLTSENIRLMETLENHKRDIVINEACKGLTESQAEQLRDVALKLINEDHEAFTTDVLSIRDRMFKTNAKRGSDITEENEVIQEEIETPEAKKTGNAEVDAIIAAINGLK